MYSYLPLVYSFVSIPLGIGVAKKERLRRLVKAFGKYIKLI